MNTLEYAIKTENDAEAFYAAQAQSHAGLKVEAVFRELARAEHKHAEKIRQTLDGAGEIDLDAGSEIETLYSDRAHFASEVRDKVSELEAYEQAMELEQASIGVYEALLVDLAFKDDAQALRERKLLEWLIVEENRHYKLFDDLREMIRHGDEYVENAEFANPPEY